MKKKFLFWYGDFPWVKNRKQLPRNPNKTTNTTKTKNKIVKNQQTTIHTEINPTPHLTFNTVPTAAQLNKKEK